MQKKRFPTFARVGGAWSEKISQAPDPLTSTGLDTPLVARRHGRHVKHGKMRKHSMQEMCEAKIDVEFEINQDKLRLEAKQDQFESNLTPFKLAYTFSAFVHIGQMTPPRNNFQ